MTTGTSKGFVHGLMKRVMGVAISPPVFRALRFIPIPHRLRRDVASSHAAWPEIAPIPLPPALRGRAGVRRDPALEQEAAAASPLQAHELVHADAVDWELKEEWRGVLPELPLLSKAEHAVLKTQRTSRRSRPSQEMVSEALTRSVKDAALRLGFSAVGVARYDPKYFCEGYEDTAAGDRVIVCVLEQRYASVQQGPSPLMNRATFDSSSEALLLASRLATYLTRQGHDACAHTSRDALAIPFAVEAGLGQLGLNGQLLTPVAGSRSRLALVTTDAALTFDAPVDFGVEAICDRCKACVERCPAGAITSTRAYHRGIWKAKINTDRCFPTVGQAEGCGVCITVCPIQRYGLRRVVEEFERSGQILGKGTDELEGYDWPVDGEHYPPGSKPRLSLSVLGRDFFHPAGFTLQERPDTSLAASPRRRSPAAAITRATARKGGREGNA